MLDGACLLVRGRWVPDGLGVGFRGSVLDGSHLPNGPVLEDGAPDDIVLLLVPGPASAGCGQEEGRGGKKRKRKEGKREKGCGGSGGDLGEEHSMR